MDQPQFTKIDLQDTELSFMKDGERLTYPRVPLPDAFMEWLIAGRRALYDLLDGKGTAPWHAAHLPVVVTQDLQAPIPFNTGNKGVGVLPDPKHIIEYGNHLEEVLKSTRTAPGKETLSERLAAVRKPLEAGHISNKFVITLEIFERGTYQNLCTFPVATLHYTGDGPVFMSFQIDAVVEILTPEHPSYRFAFLSRQLFEYDPFHITQTHFPYAYLFHPVAVKDKTPRRRP